MRASVAVILGGVLFASTAMAVPYSITAQQELVVGAPTRLKIEAAMSTMWRVGIALNEGALGPGPCNPGEPCLGLLPPAVMFGPRGHISVSFIDVVPPSEEFAAQLVAKKPGGPWVMLGPWVLSAADPTTIDRDNDGLTDAEELALGTNTRNADSDGGGTSDGEEVRIGTDPFDRWDDAELCDNGLDDDNDDLVDCYDIDCAGLFDCIEDCSNGRDDDGDGNADCYDADCVGLPECTEDCTNGVDDDVDGHVDCRDDDCWGPGCGPTVEVVVRGGEAIREFSYADAGRYCAASMPTGSRTGLDRLTLQNLEGHARKLDGAGVVVSSCDWTLASAVVERQAIPVWDSGDFESYFRGWMIDAPDVQVGPGCTELTPEQVLPRAPSFGAAGIQTRPLANLYTWANGAYEDSWRASGPTVAWAAGVPIVSSSYNHYTTESGCYTYMTTTSTWRSCECVTSVQRHETTSIWNTVQGPPVWVPTE